MRALLFNSKDYEVEFDSYANRPKGIIPEEVAGKEKQECHECIVAFITVERDDEKDIVVEGIVKEIEKMCDEVVREKVVIVPFAHLSNNLEKWDKSLEILEDIELELKKSKQVMRTHFGSNKSLLLKIHGHAGNARYREF